MLWLKRPEPAPRPKDPKHVSLTGILAQLTQDEMIGAPSSPAIKYLATNLPERPTDRWGAELPLSAVEQEKLDRIAAVMFDPGRGKQLLASARLDAIEVDALKNGQPGWYEALCLAARADMIQGKPPFPRWAENVLGVLFGRDAALVYGAETDVEKPSRSKFDGEPPSPTPADLSGEPSLKGR